jgi:hypothetical protein
VTRGAYWESTNVEHPGVTMGKVRQISADMDGFRCTNNDSHSKIDLLIGERQCSIERARLLDWH